jgi:hypothetical protein
VIGCRRVLTSFLALSSLQFYFEISSLKIRFHPPTTEELDRNRAAMSQVLKDYVEHTKTHWYVLNSS